MGSGTEPAVQHYEVRLIEANEGYTSSGVCCCLSRSYISRLLPLQYL